MPVNVTTSLVLTLPTGGTVTVSEDALKPNVRTEVVCDNPTCCAGKPRSISWVQTEVADSPAGLPLAAKDIQTLQLFDGTRFVFCGPECLVDFVVAKNYGPKHGIVRVR